MRLLRPLLLCLTASVISACTSTPGPTVIALVPDDPYEMENVSLEILQPSVYGTKALDADEYLIAWSRDGQSVDWKTEEAWEGNPWTLPSSETSNQETWTVVVTPQMNDLTGPSSTALITINTPPTATVSWEGIGNLGEDLIISIGSSDPDNSGDTGVTAKDEPGFQIVWTVDNNEYPAAEDQPFVSHEALVLDQVWSVEVTPYTLGVPDARKEQGAGVGKATSPATSITIKSQPTELENKKDSDGNDIEDVWVLAINSDQDGDGDDSTGITGDQLTCDYGIVDADHLIPEDHSDLQWYNGSDLLAEGNVHTDPDIRYLHTSDEENPLRVPGVVMPLGMGDAITCSVLPRDKDGTAGTEDTSTHTPFILGNAPPSLSNV